MRLFGLNIEKLEKKGDTDGLCKVLRTKKGSTREKVALALGRLAWEPQNDSEKAWYFAAKRDWQELAKLGEPALPPLLLALLYSEGNARREAWRYPRAHCTCLFRERRSYIE